MAYHLAFGLRATDLESIDYAVSFQFSDLSWGDPRPISVPDKRADAGKDWSKPWTAEMGDHGNVTKEPENLFRMSISHFV
jgi:hypothetical protein